MNWDVVCTGNTIILYSSLNILSLVSLHLLLSENPIVLMIKMSKIFEAIYEEGGLKLVGMPRIEGDVISVKILNRDEILTQGDINDILNALKEKSEGKLSGFEEVFG